MLYVLLFLILSIYVFFSSNSIYGGDAGDLVSAILTKGYAHPPGYPLFMILGNIFNSLPFNFLSPAGKVILISSFATISSLIILYFLIREIVSREFFNPYIACITIAVLAFNYIIFLYGIIPEVFPLNTLIVLLIFYFSVKFYKTSQPIYFYFLCLIIGLGVTHHHTFILILPSTLYLLFRKRFLIKRFSISFFIMSSVFFVIGLIPLIQLILASKIVSPIQWGRTDTIQGFSSLLMREGYGTFSAGPFVTKLPFHRILQLKNLVLFVLHDFTFLGLLMSIIGFLATLRKRVLIHRDVSIALGLGIFLFGPFFAFYANFPLKDTFFFATLERFFHAFYFFLSLYLYLGLYISYQYINTLITNKLLHSAVIKKLFTTLLMTILLIYPLGVFVKNIPLISTLRNDSTAENVAYDVFNNAEKKSIIILSQDTALFNTQYVYYAHPELKKDYILIHGNKLYSDYYYPILKKQFPELNLSPSRNVGLRIPEFIAKNMNNYHIYVNEKYPLPNLPDYQWITNGLLYKLERKDSLSSSKTIKVLDRFWRNSKNNNLLELAKRKSSKFKNFFVSDVLRIYSTSHQNTAFYLLNNDKLDEALEHIVASETLDPQDLDYLYLYSLYYEKMAQCDKAEESAFKALSSETDQLYFNRLKDIAEHCYSDTKDRDRLLNKLKKFLDKPINSFL